MPNKILEKLHKLELMIALEVKRICEKNNIKYFLIAGTLLGAVRHKGFIPWDDDMDIGMLRKDYEKFLVCCKKELDDKFFLQTWDSDPEYPFSYAKVRLKDTCFVEDFSDNTRCQTGLFIDIFPFDNVPDNVKKQKKQKKAYYFYKRFLWVKKGFGISIKKEKPVKYFLFKLCSIFLNYKFLKKKYELIQIKFNSEKTKKVVADGSYNYDKESIDSSFFEEQTEIIFENHLFTTFKRYEDYLKYFYGNYMELPPIEKRKGHLPKKIDFGVYGDDYEE